MLDPPGHSTQGWLFFRLIAGLCLGPSLHPESTAFLLLGLESMSSSFIISSLLCGGTFSRFLGTATLLAYEGNATATALPHPSVTSALLPWTNHPRLLGLDSLMTALTEAQEPLHLHIRNSASHFI